jgi:hypothetical protein
LTTKIRLWIHATTLCTSTFLRTLHVHEYTRGRAGINGSSDNIHIHAHTHVSITHVFWFTHITRSQPHIEGTCGYKWFWPHKYICTYNEHVERHIHTCPRAHMPSCHHPKCCRTNTESHESSHSYHIVCITETNYAKAHFTLKLRQYAPGPVHDTKRCTHQLWHHKM